MQCHRLLRSWLSRKCWEHRHLALRPSVHLMRRKYCRAVYDERMMKNSGLIESYIQNEDKKSIVISGISGRFANTENMKELEKNLMTGVDMVEPGNRWKLDNSLMPTRSGRLKNIEKFDAEFFKFNNTATQAMDPNLRLILEVTFEAIVDAGINPENLRGTRTGVFVAFLGGETMEYRLCQRAHHEEDGHWLLGNHNYMIPGRVSFTFDLRGPSFMMNSGCSSSLVALESAVQAMEIGTCDKAIIATSSLLLVASDTAEFSALGVLSPDGINRVFDDKANGFTRSEAAAAILIERKGDAKRQYATIRGIRSSSDGHKSEGIAHPSVKGQEALLKDTYAAAGIDPGQITYYEAHGTGTVAGDGTELQSISKVVSRAKSRKNPLIIGSVKSNVGHTESSAGISSIAKIIIARQSNSIPANLYFNLPSSAAEDLFDGSMYVATENTPWKGGLVGVSGFGIGGSIAHVILETDSTFSNEEIQTRTEINQVPILIPFSGRNEELLEQSLKEASECVQDVEAAQLLRSVFQKRIDGYDYRGFGLYSYDGTKEPTIEIAKQEATTTTTTTRPLWFVFPGLGSQWNEMGKDLMKIDVFAESIRSSQTTLKNVGVDLKYLLRPNNPTIFDDIRDAFVTIASVQIALLDTLTSMGLAPDGFVGYSIGEMLCAYADGCLTAEETLFFFDARGRSLSENKEIIGGMASVDLSWETAKTKCPPGIYPVCHNGIENVTVAGPLDKVKEFANQLQSEGIFARLVNSCGIASHSKHLAAGNDNLIKFQKEILGGKERRRSSRWISSSIPESEWNGPLAQTSSAAYHANNESSPVLFHEAIQKIPDNSIVIEVAPRAVFHEIIRESISNSSVIAPMNHSVDDKLHFFLSSIGKLYNLGIDMDIAKLYPSIKFPVSSRAASTSSLVKWKHDRSWNKQYLENKHADVSFVEKLNLKNSKNAYLNGHKLDTRCFYPATGYLVHAWKGYAASLGVNHENVSIRFENVSFEHATLLKEDMVVTLRYTHLKGTNLFVIEEDGVAKAKGSVSSPEDVEQILFNPPSIPTKFTKNSLSENDIYKEFRLNGYNYSDEFKGLRAMDMEGQWAEVAWNGNWVPFLDSVLQTKIMGKIRRSTEMPIRCGSVLIDPVTFLNFVKQQNEMQGATKDTLIPISIYPTLEIIKCPGIEIRGFTTASVSREKQQESLTIEQYRFMPYFDQQKLLQSNNSVLPSITEILTSFIHVVLDNTTRTTTTTTTEFKVLDIFSKAENSCIQQVINVFNSLTTFTTGVHMVSTFTELDKIDPSITNLAVKITGQESLEKLVLESGRVDLVLLNEITLLETLSENLENNSHVILIMQEHELHEESIQMLKKDNCQFCCLSQKQSDSAVILLLKKISSKSLCKEIELDITALCVDNENFEWLPDLQLMMAEVANYELTDSNKRFFLYSHHNPQSGIIGLVKCLKKEAGGNKIRCIFDPEGKLNLNFANPDEEVKKIIDQDLVMNVIKKGQHGTFIHTVLNQELNSLIKDVKSAYVDILSTGDLTSLRWIESPLNNLDAGTNNLCTVNYAGLNFKDIMLATGKLIKDSDMNSQEIRQLGLEYSGIDPRGNRIMGMLPGKALASSVIIDPHMTWEIPHEWSMEEAVTVPVVYATAFYALCYRGRLRSGQSVLIHSGTGGVGQAAIRIALDYNCEIFTTVGSEEKRNILKDLFPTIKYQNIGNSRDCSFEPQIKELTKGRGVDFVLNSLSGDKLHASVRCVAKHGKFLEIGKFDISQNANLGMNFFKNNIEFHGVFIDDVFTGTNFFKDNVNRLILDGITKGVVKPIPRTVFPKEQVEDAFRLMASGKHIGKVIIELQTEGNVKETSKVAAVPRTYFHADKSHVIVGGLGGLGLEVANWMVERGAKHLVLISRSGVQTGYQQLCLKKWQGQGVKVETPMVDLSDYAIAEKLVKSLIVDKKQIGGIFNSGLVLKDALIEDQTIEDFKAVAAPKVEVTKNFDKLTREYCKEGLDYFVVFSSVSCGRGNAGQSNYGFANSVMERICESRREDGLHGLAIQWGVIGEVGVVAETMWKYEGSFHGYVPQRVSSCLEVLDMALSQQKEVTTMSSVMVTGTKQLSKDSLVETISHILGVKNISSIDTSVTLFDLGMDSLMGAEINQLLDKKYGISLSISQLRKMTLANFESIESETYGHPELEKENSIVTVEAELLEIFTGGTNTMVEINSAATNENTNTKLFMIHGADGHSLTFQALADKLNCRTFAFRFGALANEHSVKELNIQDVAREYLKEIKMVQPEGPFNILCYCAGTAIAFEMVRILENEMGDQVTNFFVVDGSVTKKDLFPSGNRQAELNGIAEIIASFVGIQELKEIFKEQYSWDNHYFNASMVAKLIKTKYRNIDETMLERYTENAFTIWRLFGDYETNPTFVTSAQVTLIKSATKVDLLTDVTDAKHNLQKYCNLPVTSYTVSGDHFTCLKHQNASGIASIINNILDPSEGL